MLAPLGEIGRRIEAGEGPEVVDKMRLVEITAGQSDIGPLDPPPRSNEMQHLLKALDAAKQLGCQPHFFIENLDEPPWAEADLLGHVRDWAWVRHVVELLQRKGDGGMPRQGPGGLRQKGLFEDTEFGLWCSGFEQLLTQVAGVSAPQRVQ